MSGSVPPIRKDMPGLLRDVISRLTLVERRLTKGNDVSWNKITGAPFASIGQGQGTVRYVRVARLDGVNDSNGASLEMQYATGGDFGQLGRVTGRIHFAQRGPNAVSLKVISDLPTPVNGSATFHTRQVSTFVFELWAKLSTFNVPLSVQAINAFPTWGNAQATLTMDMVTTTAPSGLSVAAAPKILGAENDWGGKSGPDAYVSPYISRWARGVDSGGSVDAHSNANAILIGETGIYDIHCYFRGTTASDYAALALNGDRTAFENRSTVGPLKGVWTHDHAAGANNNSASHYLGQMLAGDIVTAGAYTSGTGISQAAAASTGALTVRRVA
jgi:hypothetical protein